MNYWHTPKLYNVEAKTPTYWTCSVLKILNIQSSFVALMYLIYNIPILKLQCVCSSARSSFLWSFTDQQLVFVFACRHTSALTDILMSPALTWTCWVASICCCWLLYTCFLYFDSLSFLFVLLLLSFSSALIHLLFCVYIMWQALFCAWCCPQETLVINCIIAEDDSLHCMC